MSFVSEKSKATPHNVAREMFDMQAGLKDVISFALGEPDFASPKHIVDAVIDSLKRGETHYTPNAGIPVLREAVAKSYQDRGLDYSPSEIIIGAGAISLLLLGCNAILDIGDEMILPDPGWSNYRGLPLMVGGVAVPVKIHEQNSFMFDVDDLRAAITPKTKLILINSPSNPTGGVASKENLEQIANLAKEKNLYVLTDEIYRELIWTDEPYVSIASFPGMKERTLIVDGFSKTYAMTGLRVGYAAGPGELIAAMTKLLEHVLSSVNAGMQWAGVAALTGSRDVVEDMRTAYQRRKKLIIEGLNAIDKISCSNPSGAFYAFPNITKTGLTSRDFAIRLLNETHTVVVPGTAFGEAGEGFIRLSFATSEANIEEGLRRISAFVKNL